MARTSSTEGDEDDGEKANIRLASSGDEFIQSTDHDLHRETFSESNNEGIIISFLEKCADHVMSKLSNVSNCVNEGSFVTNSSAAVAASAASAATSDFIVKQREEEVPLELFVTNPFLMNVCSLRALLNHYRDN